MSRNREQDVDLFNRWHNEHLPRRPDGALAKVFEEVNRRAFLVGITAERARLREKVEGLVGFWDNHPSKRLDGPERRLVNEIFGEVLALLDKPGEERK